MVGDDCKHRHWSGWNFSQSFLQATFAWSLSLQGLLLFGSYQLDIDVFFCLALKIWNILLYNNGKMEMLIYTAWLVNFKYVKNTITSLPVCFSISSEILVHLGLTFFVVLIILADNRRNGMPRSFRKTYNLIAVRRKRQQSDKA